MGETAQVLNGRYWLLDELGGGGMSVVWRAYDELLDRYVAVKLLAPEHADSLWPREQIRREAQAAARLSHPHVTAVHDYGEALDGSGRRVPYVVMELLSGQTLADRMADGPVEPGDALRIAAEVATALAAAHARGLAHCDVKPGNVMLTPNGVKVLDFGIASAAGGHEGPADGLVVGTPAFLAPERFTRGEVSPAADVFALGVVLYRLLAGVPPWPAESVVDRLEAHASRPPEPLPATVPVPPEVAAACLRCLAKEPDERPTAHGLAVILAEAGGWRLVPAPGGVVLAEGTQFRAPVGHVPRRRRKARTVPRPAAARRGAGTRPAPRHRSTDRRGTRLTAAALVVVLGVVAGWGLPEGVAENHRSDVAQAAPVPPSLPGGSGAEVGPVTGEDTGDTGSTGDSGSTGSTPPPHTAAVGGPVSGGVGGDPVAAPRDGSTGGSAAPRPVPEPGDSAGGGTETAPPSSSPSTPPADPTPAPKSPTTAPAPAPVEQVKTLVTALGTVVVSCVGSTASILSVSPLAGAGILEIDRGPGAEVGVALNALLLTVRIKVVCASGAPQASIQIG